jgi:hypothetical protein
VDAQFLGLKDGKLNLHKLNGVKIAVPISKMSLEDLEYVERVTGISLDEDKPLSELKKRSDAARSSSSATPSSKVGVSIEPKKSDYDWFQFFLSCDVSVGLCERYAQAFNRESIDESVLPDVDATVLRNLGLKEGDIIKVMRFLDNKFARTKKTSAGEDGESGGGLFSGPGGTLRNNTRKGRPAPAVQTSDVVDAKAFSLKDGSTGESQASPTTATSTGGASTTTSAPAAAKRSTSGFDDDAWDVKPARTPAAEPAPQPARAPEPAPAPSAPSTVPKPTPLSGAMAELSLLSQPLEPTKAAPPPAQPPMLNLAPAQPLQPQAIVPAAATQLPQPTGASPAFFTGMQPPVINGQPTGARQRPLVPQYTQGQGSLMPPPPARPLSAPQSAQPSAFTPPPLQPQMTGNPNMYQPQQQLAPPGQSLAEINQARLQQQYAQQMQQQQMMMPQPTGFGGPQQQQQQYMQPQPTGFAQPQQFLTQQQQQPMPGQMQQQSPFADPRSTPQTQFPAAISMLPQQPTGFQPQQFPPQQQPFMPQPTGINSFLPAPLQPQPTGMSFAQGFGNAPQVSQMQQQPQQTGGLQPLVPQKTGPPPPVRFGVTGEKKLVPQATGRRANLAQASKLIFLLILLPDVSMLGLYTDDV